MQFCTLYIDQKKVSRDGKKFGVLYDDAMVACRIAEYEGVMLQAANMGHEDTYHYYQGRIRSIFANRSLIVHKELETSYSPPYARWARNK